MRKESKVGLLIYMVRYVERIVYVESAGGGVCGCVSIVYWCMWVCQYCMLVYVGVSAV